MEKKQTENKSWMPIESVRAFMYMLRIKSVHADKRWHLRVHILGDGERGGSCQSNSRSISLSLSWELSEMEFFFPGSLFLYQPTDFVFRCSARTSFPGAAYFPPQRSCTYMALHQRTSRSRSNYVGITKVTECLSRDQRKICCTSLMNVVRYNSLSDSDNFLFVLYVLL